jgi:AcrR family transcriptional regulator
LSTRSKAERPLRSDARDNRVKLLAAARRLFDKRGLDVGVDDVAREAGLGVGTFYRHFPTKEALFQATLVSHLEDLRDAAREALEASDADAAFFEFLSRFAELGRKKKNLMAALAQHGLAMPMADQHVAKDFHEAFDAVMARARRERVIREGITSQDLVALVRGAYSAGDEASRTRLFSVICDGLRPPKRH